jgi:arginase
VSGFLAGMSLAKITGRGDQQLVQDIFMANLPDDDVLLADARDLDPAEKILIENSGIHWIRNVNEIRQFNFNSRPVYIHFDTDIIDSRYAPAILYPVPGGPSPDDLSGLFQYLVERQYICAVSVTPWEPSSDADGHTKELCMRLINELS